jgi:DNA-binding MarR family transcriptional regulator
MNDRRRALDGQELQERLTGFIRSFGLHQPDRTPCGQPVPVSEAHALSELLQHGTMTQLELGRRLRLEKSTVSRLVGQLAARGWVERVPNPGDARSVQVSLTSAGHTAAGELAAARAAKFARLLDAIPEPERDSVLRALRILTEALK